MYVRLFARSYRDQNLKIGRVGETKNAKFVEHAARVEPTVDPVPIGHKQTIQTDFGVW